MFAGLSSTSVTWWANVEQAATAQYHRWLTADPLDRLLLDPGTVFATFDAIRYQLVESRAVSLILAAVPSSLRDEAVSNRWLTTASLLFRIQCIYQPGGSSERAMLLSQLVSPDQVKTFGAGVMMLRKWQQHFHRVRELQASLPDSSLLLKGVDAATGSILAQHPSLAFRVNTFRNRVSLDYNPSVASVVQLVKLLQAEFESASLTSENPVSDRRRAALLQAPNPPPPPKAPPMKAPSMVSPEGVVKALDAGADSKGKGKGKGKGKEEVEAKLCHGFSEAKGCRYGDSCKFKHDRATARQQKRCLACGQEGHYRPECPIVPPERRVVQDPSGPFSGPHENPKAASPKRVGDPKGKSAPQAKGIVGDVGAEASSSSAIGEVEAHKVLMEEAANLLKGVSLKPLRLASEDPEVCSVASFGIDRGWLLNAVMSASDPHYALIDSGATNALRPAEPQELEGSQVIKVDLASGATELHVNGQGTLLSTARCQVIIPAGYLRWASP